MSLREIARSRILKHIIRASRPQAGDARTHPGRYMVLVMDRRATRIVSAAVRMYDVMEEGLALVEGLEKKRQPMPELEVIYFVEPSLVAVQSICADFVDPSCPMYGDVHIFFTRPVGEDVVAEVRRNSFLISRVKAFSEANLDFLVVEPSAFHFDMPGAFRSLYAPDHVQLEACKVAIVERLVTVCATLNEYPFIRYTRSSSLSAGIANRIQDRLNAFAAANKTFWFHGDGLADHGDQSRRATLVVLDRASTDPLAPLLHEFTYQAMVHDLLPVKDHVLTYATDRATGRVATQTVLLNDNDAVWKAFRHTHIKNVIHGLSKHLEHYRNTSLGRVQAGGVADWKELQKAVKNLPQYREMMAKNEQHIAIASQCMSAMQSRKLLEVADLEQSMATGVNKDGRELSAARATAALSKMMRDESICAKDTQRLLAIYIISQNGIIAADRMRLIREAQPPFTVNMQNAIINLVHIGISLQKGDLAGKDPRALQRAKEIALKCDYSVCRYAPALSGVVSRCIENTLAQEAYPYIYDPPPNNESVAPNRAFLQSSTIQSVRQHDTGVRSQRSHTFKALWARKDAKKPIAGIAGVSSEKMESNERAGDDKKFGRTLVFIAGGVTYSELRAMYELAHQTRHEIIIGSTSLLTADSYLAGLASFDVSQLVTFNDMKAPQG